MKKWSFRWPLLVRLHPLFLVLLAVSIYGHFFRPLALLFAVVLLHEWGHALVAIRLGYTVASIELYPFGGVAQLVGKNVGWKPQHEVAIAVAGPLVNLFLALFATLLLVTGAVSEALARPFISLNFTLMFFNLLPALPLDGGRIARASLAASRGFETATKVVTRMSLVISAGLVLLGGVALWLGYPDAGMLILGVFLLVSALGLRRQNRYETLRFLDHKRREIPPTQPLRTLVVAEDVGIGNVAAQLVPGAYHLIYLQNQTLLPEETLTLSQPIEERELLRAIFEDGLWLEPIGILLRTSGHL